MESIERGSEWVAKWSQSRKDAYIWTVRGVTIHGVYITCPNSRSYGHLLSESDFKRDYLRKAGF